MRSRILRILSVAACLATGSLANGLDYSTWIAPPPQDQLDHEAEDDRKGFGRIFIPAMSDGAWEPLVTVYDGSRIVQTDAPIGKSIFLEPGHYKLMFGNGIIPEQKLVQHVNVRAGETQLVQPEWSGLIIRIVDPTRQFLRQNFEVFGMQYEESFGISISKDENEPDEHPDTWLLRPGLYKITKAGMPFNTPVQFATVQLLPGTLTQFTIVMDEDNNFVGSGIMREFETRSLARTPFKAYSALNANFDLSSSDRDDEDEFVTQVDVVTEFFNRFKYDYGQHYFLSEPSYELQLSNTVEESDPGLEESRGLDVRKDKLDLENIYIFYVFNKVGLYARVDMESKVFPEADDFGAFSPVVYTRDSDGNVVDSTDGETRFETRPVFSDMTFQESIGLDFTPVRTSKLRLSLRTGWGFWQDVNPATYVNRQTVTDTLSDTLISVSYEKLQSDFRQGLELQALSDYQPTSKIIWSTKLELLFTRGEKTIYELENKVNLSLIKFLSVEYQILFAQDAIRDYPWVENNLGMKLTYIF